MISPHNANEGNPAGSLENFHEQSNTSGGVAGGQQMVTYGQKGKVTTVPLSLPPYVKDKLALAEKIQALTVNTDDVQEELRKKMELLKGRYQHAVKTELINFCYASSHASGDDGLLPPEASNRSPGFIKMLMNIVEKDKHIADIAVNMVEEIDQMEKAELGYKTSKRDKEKENAEDAALKEIWENHKKSRQEIAKLLDEEQMELYPNKKYSFVPPTPNLFDDSEDEYADDFEEEQQGQGHQGIQKTNKNEEFILSLFENIIGDKDDADVGAPAVEKSAPGAETLFSLNETLAQQITEVAEAEEEETENEIIKRGLEKILSRLGYTPDSLTADTTDNLNLIRNKILTIKEDIQTLKSLDSSRN